MFSISFNETDLFDDIKNVIKVFSNKSVYLKVMGENALGVSQAFGQFHDT